MNAISKRSLVGQKSNMSGHYAEISARAEYAAQGATILEQRWRGQAGEIDLIVKDGADYVFAEVKHATTADLARTRLRPDQIRRIADAAAEYLEQTPNGQLSPVRFDLVLVDGMGQVTIQRNAFGYF